MQEQYSLYLLGLASCWLTHGQGHRSRREIVVGSYTTGSCVTHHINSDGGNSFQNVGFGVCTHMTDHLRRLHYP